MENRETLGMRIASLRRKQDLTQEELGEKLGVSSQAVSKWENDISAPDISILPALAGLLGTTVDALLTGKEAIESVRYNADGAKKDINNTVFRIRVLCSDGDKVNINFPFPLLKILFQAGGIGDLKFGNSKNGSNPLSGIDFKMLFDLVESGALGKLLEVESADGDIVEIVVE